MKDTPPNSTSVLCWPKRLLSADDLNLRDLTDDELDRAWDLWFDLAQSTNEWDPPYTHGVLVGLGRDGNSPAAADNETTSVSIPDK